MRAILTWLGVARLVNWLLVRAERPYLLRTSVRTINPLFIGVCAVVFGAIAFGAYVEEVNAWENLPIPAWRIDR